MAAYVKSAFSKVKQAVFSDGGSDEYKMLLIGETGSGKTSFLNLLWNCRLIVELGIEEGLQKLKHVNDIQLENAKAGMMESKTSGAKMYPGVQLAGGLKVGIIDTPGFGDSRGIEEDKKHSGRIVEALKGEEYVNCICLVINGRLSRASATLQYVLSEITAILPREVLNNVIVVFTNTADPLDLNFDHTILRKYLGKPIEEEKIFFVENPYCRVEKAKNNKQNLSQEMIRGSLKRSFEQTSEAMDKMSRVISKFERVHTHRFTALYETKQKVEKEVVYLLMAYDNQTELEKNIAQAEEQANAALLTKNLHANYRSTQTYKRWVQKSTSRHNTLCGAAGCYSNCHAPCYLPKAMDKETFKSCRSMSGDYCTQCRHHYTVHYHNEVEHVLEEDCVPHINVEAKRKFESAKSQEERYRILQDHYRCEREKSEKKRKQLSENLLLTITQFEKLGATRSYARVLQDQFAMVDQRFRGVNPAKQKEYKHLRKTKEEIKKKLEVVQKTLKGPWSHDTNPETQINWACAVLEVDRSATTDEVMMSYKKMANTSHPDKPGGDEEHFKRVQRARDILAPKK